MMKLRQVMRTLQSDDTFTSAGHEAGLWKRKNTLPQHFPQRFF